MRKLPGGYTLREVMVAAGLGMVLAALVLPSFSKARARVDGAACELNLKDLGRAWSLYIEDWDERFPPKRVAETDWYGALWDYRGSAQRRGQPTCPAARPAGSGYAYNGSLVTPDGPERRLGWVGLNLWLGDSAPGRTVLCWCIGDGSAGPVVEGRSPTSPRSRPSWRPRHSGLRLVCYNDGGVALVADDLLIRRAHPERWDWPVRLIPATRYRKVRAWASDGSVETAARICDGSSYDGWVMSLACQSAWAEIDLGEFTTLSNFGLDTCRWSRFEAQYQDATGWHTFADGRLPGQYGEGRPPGTYYLEFAPVKARRVRLLLHRGLDAGKHSIASPEVGEFQVW